MTSLHPIYVLLIRLLTISTFVWLVWLNDRAFARDPKGRGFESRPVHFHSRYSLRQAAHTHAHSDSIEFIYALYKKCMYVPLSPSSMSSLTSTALWRMQLTFPYNTQLGAVPYRMVMKQCISSTFYSQGTGVFLLAFLYCQQFGLPKS